MTFKGLTEFSQNIHHRQQYATALCEFILDVLRIPTEVMANDELISLHVAQPLNKCATANRKQAIDQFHGSSRSMCKFPNNQQRPLVANHLQRT